MIRLLIVDAGNTLGSSGAPGPGDLAALSPLPIHLLRAEMRRFLHCVGEATVELLDDFCEAVHIDPARLPQDWTSSFGVYEYAREAVSALIAITGAPVVVLSNMPCTTGPSRMRALHAQIPAIDAIYTSYEMGRRKPDRRLWRRVCEDYRVHPSEAVHVGDQWVADIHGAIRAGCNALFVQGTREGNSAPSRAEWPAGSDRIKVISDLSEAPSVIAEMHER